MALVPCPECDAKVSDYAVSCPHCGFPLTQGAAARGIPTADPALTSPAPTPAPPRLLEGNPAYDSSPSDHRRSTYAAAEPYSVDQERAGRGSGHTVFKSARSRGLYIILALFFGMLGVHNFYAGYLVRGFFQLLIVLVLGWFVIGFVIVGLWVLIEMFTVTKDASGDPLV